MPQGECRIGTAQRMRACAVSGPRIVRIKEHSYVSFQLLTCPLVKRPYSGIE